jgi:hypothetical protein
VYILFQEEITVETVCQNMRDLLKKIDTSPTLKEADKESEKLMVKI